MAHCRRTLPLSIDLVRAWPEQLFRKKHVIIIPRVSLQVHQLLTSGANLLMFVEIVKNDDRIHLGTVVDYAYEAFKEVQGSF